jgi:Myb-like DNA-binding domain
MENDFKILISDPQEKRRAQAWTVNEEELFVGAHRELGNRWKEISDRIGHKSENQVKNYFYSTLRKITNQLIHILGVDAEDASSPQL